MEFREGLLSELAARTGIRAARRMPEHAAFVLTQALADLQPPAFENPKYEEAVRLILFDLWRSFGRPRAEAEIQPILAGSWAGDVLARTQRHEAARIEARRRYEEENSPERIEQRREEKRRLKQEKHAERLAKQKERARLWHMTYGPGAN